MNFWPKHSFEIETPLSVSEVVAVLDSVTEPVKSFRWLTLRDHRIFEGVVSADGFRIKRIVIHYRNSFRPIIRGFYRKGQPGAIVSISMKLPPFVVSFLYAWFGFVGTIFLISVIPFCVIGTVWIPGAIGSLVMLFLAWRMSNWSFWFDVKETRPILEKILLRNNESNSTPTHS